MKEFYSKVNRKLYYISMLIIIGLMISGLIIGKSRFTKLELGYILHFVLVTVLSVCLLIYPKRETHVFRKIIILLGSAYFYILFFIYPETWSTFILICFIPAISILFFDSKLFYFSFLLNGLLIILTISYIILFEHGSLYTYLKEDLVGNIINLAGIQVVLFLIYYISFNRIKKIQHYFELQVHFEELSKLDSLTGLLNVSQFEYGLKFEMQLFKENRELFSLLMIDIDKFKNINDTYGHLVGDSVLKQLATLLKRNCRSGDLVCRKGGEEFAIILPSCSKEMAIEIAERIRHEVEIHQFDEQKRFGVTISIGVAMATNESLMDSERLIELADKELYKAKNKGRNKVCIA